MRGGIFLIAVWLCGQASALTQTTLDYDLSAGGFGVADFRVVVQVDGQVYRADAWGTTFGAADVFGSLTVLAFSTGTMAGSAIAPATFGTDNIYEGDARRTRVVWSGGEAVAAEVVPSLAEERRSPIPDDARQSALDPIAALMTLARGEPSTGACGGSVKVFDGRRSYTLALSADEEGTSFDRVPVGKTVVDALKCKISSDRTGGKSPGGLFSSSSTHETASIWFWATPDGIIVPVRIEADAILGSAIATLTSYNFSQAEGARK